MALSDCFLLLVESDVASPVPAVFDLGIAVAFVLFLARYPRDPVPDREALICISGERCSMNHLCEV